MTKRSGQQRWRAMLRGSVPSTRARGMTTALLIGLGIFALSAAPGTLAQVRGPQLPPPPVSGAAVGTDPTPTATPGRSRPVPAPLLPVGEQPPVVQPLPPEPSPTPRGRIVQLPPVVVAPPQDLAPDGPPATPLPTATRSAPTAPPADGTGGRQPLVPQGSIGTGLNAPVTEGQGAVSPVGSPTAQAGPGGLSRVPPVTLADPPTELAPPPITPPAWASHSFELTYTGLDAIEESGPDWWGSDEPYVVWIIANLVEQRYELRRTQIYGDVDTGESRHERTSLWGPAPLPGGDPDNLLILVQVMEHDGSNVDDLLRDVEIELNTYCCPWRQGRAAVLETMQFRAGNAFGGAILDDPIGGLQELPLTLVDLVAADAGLTVPKTVDSEGLDNYVVVVTNGARYRTNYEFQRR